MPTVNDPNGQPQAVDDEGRAHTFCITVSEEHHSNKNHESAYTWQFSDDPDAADDCIFYLKNNDDRLLVLEGMDIQTSAACGVYIKKGGTGTTAAGTTITGTNMNAGSGNTADVTSLHDGDIEAGGSFSGAVETNRWTYAAAKDTHNLNFPLDIIIPKNQVFTLWVDTIAIVVAGTVYGYFHH